jgi:hypothetical protein
LDIDGKVIKGVWEAEHRMDLNVSVNALYVYCDIVKSSVVGDTYSKLLRVVNIPRSDFGDNLQRIYEQPLYFPLEKREFESIEIDVKDDAGETLKFDGGRITSILHFRKSND